MIQQESAPDLHTPWPVFFNRLGTIEAGRPDAERLIGFQEGDVAHVVLWTEDVTDAAQMVGLVPVFVAKDGSGLFAVNLPVRTATL